jgi:hypothetical protein
MKSMIGLTVFSVVLVFSGGCGGGSGEGIGGGVYGVGGGTAVCGYSGANDRLGFVIFTDQGRDTIGTASSSWRGSVKTVSGPTVHYDGSSGGIGIDGSKIDIEGTEYNFANGRVFLVSTEGDEISVRQLDIPLSDVRYDAEIDRIAALKEVQEFLGN